MQVSWTRLIVPAPFVESVFRPAGSGEEKSDHDVVFSRRSAFAAAHRSILREAHRQRSGSNSGARTRIRVDDGADCVHVAKFWAANSPVHRREDQRRPVVPSPLGAM